MPHLLPYLRARNLGCRRIFHQVVDWDATIAAEPCFQILNADVDVHAQTLLGDAAHVGSEQIRGADMNVLTLGVNLIFRGHVLVEYLFGHGNQSRMGNPGAIVTRLNFTKLVLAHFSSALSFAGGSLLMGICAAIPPIA